MDQALLHDQLSVEFISCAVCKVCSSRECSIEKFVSMAMPVTVTVLKGFGGERVSMPSIGLSVTDLVQHVEEQTDWLWGIGTAYELRDGLSFAVIRWDHIFSTDASTLVLLYYLPYRVTSSGFPCWQCYIFVSWSDPRWYTRYTMTKGLPIQQWMSDPVWAEYVTIFLYAPREYWCAECGPSIPDTFGRIECVEVDSITSRKTYSSYFDWLLDHE